MRAYWVSLLSLCILFALTACGRAEEPKRHPLAHVIQITASLTFDGKPVRIEDMIDCYMGYTGTPTSNPREVFKPNRHRITHEVPGGGMISFRVSRELCYVNGNQWGSGLPSFSAPAEWTPVLEWYDHRDLRKRTWGMWYMSEGALKNPDGRLKIVEPFVVSTPEHPATEDLLAEVERQQVERYYYRDVKTPAEKAFNYNNSPMVWMFRMPEYEWRDPKAARPEHRFTKGPRSKEEPDYSALARILDDLPDEGMTHVGYPSDLGVDAEWLVQGLSKGRRGGVTRVFEFGIPIRGADRFGMLLTSTAAAKTKKHYPYFPSYFDDHVPIRCVDGILATAPETPGLVYWYRDNCKHPDIFRGRSFFGENVSGERVFSHDKLIFDAKRKDLWRVTRGAG
ncbi:MAG: hypothetical protein AAGD13_17680 [Pseudomonadota bacterium]